MFIKCSRDAAPPKGFLRIAHLSFLGAQVCNFEGIVVPSAFALETGRAHWEVLTQARAIETGTYIAAPAQVFSHGGGRHQCL